MRNILNLRFQEKFRHSLTVKCFLYFQPVKHVNLTRANTSLPRIPCEFHQKSITSWNSPCGHRQTFNVSVSQIRKLTTSSFSANVGNSPKGDGNNAEKKVTEIIDETKLTLFQRFKKMYRDYWYVLIPVHGITSAMWLGSFFYAAKSGVDIVPLLEWMNVPEKFVSPVRGSAGHVAVAYAMYKVATPLRYTVTLGGTTLSINFLQRLGYIKPVPTAQRFREMYCEKRLKLRQKREEIQARIRAQKLQLRKRIRRRQKFRSDSQNNGK